ncbi:MAG: hypothetical protein VKJ06_01585 [Vampirovibrionales bacterium]|nr:hypothetical protein [Vampirovibrionales bacterium]
MLSRILFALSLALSLQAVVTAPASLLWAEATGTHKGADPEATVAPQASGAEVLKKSEQRAPERVESRASEQLLLGDLEPMTPGPSSALRNEASGAMAAERSDGSDVSDAATVDPAKTITTRAVVDIDSKTLTYDELKDVYIARGDASSQVHVVVSEQNSELIADEVTYDKNTQQMIARGHVIILRNGTRTDGTFARIDLGRKSALIQKPVTKLEAVRVKADVTYVSDDYYEMRDGRFILDGAQATARIGRGRPRTPAEDPTLTTDARTGQRIAPSASIEAYSDPLGDTAGLTPEGMAQRNAANAKLANEVLDLSEPQPDNKSPFHIKVGEVDVYREEDGYNKVLLKQPSLYYKKFKVATAHSADFSLDAKAGTTEYLGPDIGFDPDLGGLYAGPGYDFRLLNGVARVSPILTYGNTARRSDGGRRLSELDNPLGIGIASHFRNSTTALDAFYSTSAQQAVLYGEHRLTQATRLMGALHQDYTNGFLGVERPGYSLQVTDRRQLARFGAFSVDSFSSLGALKDDFFPTNRQRFFVSADTSGEPEVAGRAQFQVRLRNNRPLVNFKNILTAGFEAQGLFSAYSTSDFRSILRGGPTAQLSLGPVTSRVRYFASNVTGETPFVADAFYQGRHNVSTINQYKLSEFISVGMQNSFSLQKDNARGDLVIGNAVYALFGPKELKVRLSYDFINQRSAFTVNFFPTEGDLNVDFDTMRVYQPQNYGTASGRQWF